MDLAAQLAEQLKETEKMKPGEISRDFDAQYAALQKAAGTSLASSTQFENDMRAEMANIQGLILRVAFRPPPPSGAPSASPVEPIRIYFNSGSAELSYGDVETLRRKAAV